MATGSCDHTGGQRICGRPVDEIPALLDHPEVRALGENDTWRLLFCPRLACHTIAWWIKKDVTPGDLQDRLTLMGPGAELPALLAHLRLLEPMYSQSRELWDTVAPIWGRSMFQWMQKLINSRVVIQHLHPQRQELCWTWCSNFAMGWRADPRSMLAWVDSHMYSTVNTDPEVLTRKYIDARVEQIRNLFDDELEVIIAAVANGNRQLSAHEQALVDEVAQLLNILNGREQRRQAGHTASTPSDAGGGSGGGGRRRHRRNRGERRRGSLDEGGDDGGGDDDDDDGDDERSFRQDPAAERRRRSARLTHWQRHVMREEVWRERVVTDLRLQARRNDINRQLGGG